MAGGITSTGQDFEHMLHSLLTFEGLPQTVCADMETDWTKAPVKPSGDGWFGHYGFGHVSCPVLLEQFGELDSRFLVCIGG